MDYWENIDKNTSKLLKKRENRITHTDFRQMMKDMLDFSDEDPGTIILAADDPPYLIGYVVYYIKDSKEVVKTFYMTVDNAARTIGNKRLLDAKGRTRLCDKGLLAHYIGE